MKRKIICAITGKNIWGIGNGLSETYYKNADIKLSVMQKISEFIKIGVTDFLCNGEYGFPLWAAEIILSLRDKQGFSAVKLHLIMPYELQGSDWSDDVHERFYDVHRKADSVLRLYRQFHDKCYENSERIMIDLCDFLFTDDEYNFASQYAELHNKPSVVCEKLERI
jgi:uncharacterized phage-like protein YoqJ